MEFIITDKGIKVLEEMGLRQAVEQGSKGLDSLINGFWSVEEREEYACSHRIHPLLSEKLSAGSPVGEKEFIIYSFVNPNQLAEAGKIPRNLLDGIMSAIGAYVLTTGCARIGRKHYSFRDKKFFTDIFGDIHGDFFLNQFNHVPAEDLQARLFEDPVLIKRLCQKDKGGLYGHYDYWTEFLKSLVYFCCQTGAEVPFRHDFEKVFYEGKLPSDKPGMVAEREIEMLRYYEKNRNKAFKTCLPKLPGFEGQMQEGWGFEGRIEQSQGFIINGNLAFCRESKTGSIEFMQERWGEPDVFIAPGMVREAVFGAVSLIRDSAGRNEPQDAGLILRHFPYYFFEAQTQNI